MSRSLSRIAIDIWKDWPAPYFGAVPYLCAMAQCDTINDHFGYGREDLIVRYFLSNAKTWRGENARKIKAELKTILGVK